MLGFFEKKNSVVQAIVMNTVGSPVWTKRDYEQLAREGYLWNVTVFACTRFIADCVAGINWSVYKDKTKKKKLENHKLLDLLSRPNPYQVWDDFIVTDISYEMLIGNSYIEALTADSDSKEKPIKGEPKQLWTLRPDRMKIVPGTNELVNHYLYGNQGNQVRIDKSRILHRKGFHPLDDFYGMGSVAGGAASIDTDNAALKWNAHLLMNSARPSGIIFLKGEADEAKFEKLQKTIQEKYTGPENAGRPLMFLSEDGGDFKQTSLTPAELDFTNSKQMTGKEICRAFKMPPELMGFTDPTFNNRKEAKKSLYEETILPKMDKLRDWLNVWLCPMFKDATYLDYDKNDIEALSEDKDKVHARVREDVRAGLITINEARKETGRDEYQDELADKLLLPFNAVPIDEFAMKDEKLVEE